jgi:hypothetical protein
LKRDNELIAYILVETMLVDPMLDLVRGNRERPSNGCDCGRAVYKGHGRYKLDNTSFNVVNQAIREPRWR